MNPNDPSMPTPAQVYSQLTAPQQEALSRMMPDTGYEYDDLGLTVHDVVALTHLGIVYGNSADGLMYLTVSGVEMLIGVLHTAVERDAYRIRVLNEMLPTFIVEDESDPEIGVAGVCGGNKVRVFPNRMGTWFGWMLPFDSDELISEEAGSMTAAALRLRAVSYLRAPHDEDGVLAKLAQSLLAREFPQR